MKKIYLLLISFLSLFVAQTNAQVSSYVFSQSSGTYTPITGTLVAEATDANPAGPDNASMDDFTFSNVPIGFPFRFNGLTHTTFNANTNGWISFGSTSTSTSGPISSTNAYNSVISASAFDMMGSFATSATRTLGSNILTAVANTTFCKVGKPIQGTGIPAGTTITAFDANTITMSNVASASSTATFVSFATGEIRTSLTGIAPNRTLIIQYSGFSQYSASLSTTTNNTSLEYQVHLIEGGTNGETATASIVYGTYYRLGGSSTTQVGLRGLGNTDYNNRSSTTDWSATIAGTSNSATVTFSNTVFPTSGLTYTWTPVGVFVDYCNLQFPPTATIALGGSEVVYTRGYEPGVTEAPGAGAGLTVWIGTYGANVDPATWPLSAWVPATFNVQVGNDDEFSASIGATLGAGTHYYASRWLLNNGQYRYGGYNATGGGYWDGVNNVNGVLNVTAAIPNDVCSGAIALTANPDLSCTASTTGTTVGATQSSEVPPPTCNAAGINDDVWYSFVATATSHIVSITGATSTTAAQVYGGTCANLTTIVCGSTSSGIANVTANGLVLGNTYFVRVFSTSAVVSTTSNFTICINTPPAPPANDNICAAITLSVSNGPTCITALTGQSTQSATQSLAGCAGTADDDVWYSFVATNTTHIITIANSGTGSTDRVHQLFSSSDNTCNGILTSISCSDPESSINTGLTIGNTYFVRVYSYGTGNIATFDICITTPPPPPSNDNICGAVSLSVSPDPTCVTSLTGQSTQGATQSLVSCNGGTADEDIWYSFVATNTTHIITITSSGTGSTDRVHQLFSSSDNTCSGTLTSIGCSDPETSTNTGLTIGNTYFVRVYSYGSGNFATFDICITSPAACPAPTGVSAGTITNTSANITFTGTGTFILEYGLTGFTPGTGATPGAGGTIISPATSPQAITGLTGSTAYQVYIRQDCTGSANGFSANTTAVSFTTLGPPPANDECTNATVIGSTPLSSSTANATQSQSAITCGGFTSSTANDVWFQFTALSSGDATVTLSNAAGGLDAVIQAFSGSCGTLSNIGCADGTIANGNEVLVLNGLSAGQTYFIQVYGYNPSRGSFDITVTGAALPISVEYFRGTKQTNSNLLDWKVTCYNSPTVKMEVERSADGRNFKTIQSQTETALRCLQPFSFADTDPLSGINYYRLKSTDVDGKITYSATVAILNKSKGFEIVSMIPNPVETKAILSISSAVRSTMEIVVTDLSGKQLSKQRVVLVAGSNQVLLNLSNLAAGTYQVTGVTDEGERKSLRFVKQ